MDHRQQICLCRHQAAFVVPASFDQPIDGSRDQRIVEIELGLDQIGLGALQRRLGRQIFRDGVVHVLLAHRLFHQQRLHPRQILSRLHDAGFRFGNLRLGALIGSFEGHGIDLIQPVAGFDLAAFGKQDLLQDPGDLGTNLNGP